LFLAPAQSNLWIDTATV